MRTLKFRSYDTVEQTYCKFIPEHLDRELYPHIRIQQFTGLTDKAGTEIYEGDIVHTDYYKDNGFNTKAWSENQEIRFIDGAWRLGDFDELFIATDNNEYGLEVIGNIYENPELLPLTTKEEERSEVINQDRNTGVSNSSSIGIICKHKSGTYRGRREQYSMPVPHQTSYRWSL